MASIHRLQGKLPAKLSQLSTTPPHTKRICNHYYAGYRVYMEDVATFKGLAHAK